MRITPSIIAFSMLMNFIPGALGDCVCTHNDQQGSWDDHNSPVGALGILLARNDGQYDASVQGHMSVRFSNISDNVGGSSPDCNSGVNIKSCMLRTTDQWTGYGGTWLLWSVIHCEDSDGVADITVWA